MLKKVIILAALAVAYLAGFAWSQTNTPTSTATRTATATATFTNTPLCNLCGATSYTTAWNITMGNFSDVDSCPCGVVVDGNSDPIITGNMGGGFSYEYDPNGNLAWNSSTNPNSGYGVVGNNAVDSSKTATPSGE